MPHNNNSTSSNHEEIGKKKIAIEAYVMTCRKILEKLTLLKHNSEEVIAHSKQLDELERTFQLILSELSENASASLEPLYDKLPGLCKLYKMLQKKCDEAETKQNALQIIDAAVALSVNPDGRKKLNELREIVASEQKVFSNNLTDTQVAEKRNTNHLFFVVTPISTSDTTARSASAFENADFESPKNSPR